MRILQHPATGEHVHTSRATAERLIAEGWSEVKEAVLGEPSDAAPPAKKTSAKKTEPPAPSPDSGSGGSTGEIQPPDKPLDEMKMPDLVEYAGKIGMAADAVAALKKPGMSKAKAKDAIAAFVAAAKQ